MILTEKQASIIKDLIDEGVVAAITFLEEQSHKLVMLNSSAGVRLEQYFGVRVEPDIQEVYATCEDFLIVYSD